MPSGNLRQILQGWSVTDGIKSQRHCAVVCYLRSAQVCSTPAADSRFNHFFLPGWIMAMVCSSVRLKDRWIYATPESYWVLARTSLWTPVLTFVAFCPLLLFITVLVWLLPRSDLCVLGERQVYFLSPWCFSTWILFLPWVKGFMDWAAQMLFRQLAPFFVFLVFKLLEIQLIYD